MRRKLLVALCLSAGANAQTYYGNGYTIVESMDAPSMDLNTRVFKTISASSVGEGLTHLLQGSGWELARSGNTDPALWRLLQQPYPDFKRTLSPMPLGQALQYIAGDAWDLVVDPVNRLISFEINEHYLTQIKPLPLPEPVAASAPPVAAAPLATPAATQVAYPAPAVYNDPPKAATAADHQMVAALTEAGKSKSSSPVKAPANTKNDTAKTGYDMGTFLNNVNKSRGRK